MGWCNVCFDLFESNQSPNFNVEGVGWYLSTKFLEPRGWEVRVVGMVECLFDLFESNLSPNFNLEGVD